jgi:hypothetical protein
VLNLRYDSGKPVGRDEIALVEHDQCPVEAEQVEDRRMFQRLGHHAVVGGDSRFVHMGW